MGGDLEVSDPWVSLLVFAHLSWKPPGIGPCRSSSFLNTVLLTPRMKLAQDKGIEGWGKQKVEVGLLLQMDVWHDMNQVSRAGL